MSKRTTTNEKMSCSTENIEQTIYFFRGRKVILSADLARLYSVETKALIQAVKRNISRFPEDFMFQLNEEETFSLRSQIVTLKIKIEIWQII